MRKLLLSLAAAGTALVVASPAAAQYYPQPYGNNGYGYGFQNNWGQVRSLQARIDNVERQIDRLDHRDRIGDRSADRLRRDADDIERRLHRVSRNGLNPYEANEIQVRIARLEQRVQFAMNDRYGRYGYNSGYGYADRDHDGRDDRSERRDRDDD
jgi:tetrahydromethanopterin S-methyltransferase subunit G